MWYAATLDTSPEQGRCRFGGEEIERSRCNYQLDCLIEMLAGNNDSVDDLMSMSWKRVDTCRS